ncbi:MAG: polyprenyl synthetase family protein [Verrucomicrobiaceae bacterium]|nr:polyprenyl synthetase family protein [Verrucomicrobiaceae bacterium]
MPAAIDLQAAPPEFPFELVRGEVQKVEQAILDQARAFDPALEGYVSYVCKSSGKRIRPALALLAGGATGGVSDDHRKLAVILELVHIASLVHDDIMDGAELRRGAPTASAKWGNALSVLLGDMLFAHALDLASEFDDSAVSRAIARASKDVCAGEILQTQRRHDLTLTVSEYLRVIEMKTAALFSAATEMAAYLNPEGRVHCAALKNYGTKLGTAYQIYDDCLDLVGNEQSAGKTLGTDLAKGKLTLPLLYLLESATEVQRSKISKRIVNGEPMDTSILAGIADYAGSIERAVQFAKNMLIEARSDLIALAASPEKSALDQITRYLDKLLDKCRA